LYCRPFRRGAALPVVGIFLLAMLIVYWVPPIATFLPGLLQGLEARGTAVPWLRMGRAAWAGIPTDDLACTHLLEEPVDFLLQGSDLARHGIRCGEHLCR